MTTENPIQAIAAEAVPKLTGWKHEPSVAELKQDLLEATPFHKTQITQIDGWLDNLHVRGKAKVTTPKGNSAIQPKLIRKQAEWRYAALSEPFLSTPDIFKVKPKTWEDRDAALQNQLVLNHQFNAYLDKVRFIDEYVRAAVDEGTVILRVGWCFVEEEVTERVPVVQFRPNPQLAPMYQQLDRLQAESPSQYALEVPEEIRQAHALSRERGVPVEAVVTGYREEKRMKTVKNHPTVEVCDYNHVVIDPTCRGDIAKAGFVIYSFETSLAELEKDGKYKNLELINPDMHSPLAEPDHAGDDAGKNFTFADRARKKIVVYEYWGFRDLDGSGVVKPFVAAWVGDIKIRMEENPFPDKAIPFEVVSYLPVRKSVYGEPDGALLEDNQKVIGAVTRGMIDIMAKSANGQTGIRKDMLDASNRRKFENGRDYEFNANVDPRQGVFMHTYPEIPASAQFMLQLQNMEAESLTGVKSWTSGVSGQSLGDVAAAVRGALDAASKRELGILRRLSAGLVRVARKILAMNGEFLEDSEVIRITNEEFVQVRRDDLAGSFDLELSISTAEEDNNKAEQLAFMLQTIGPNGDPELGKMILSDICRLRKMPDLAKKIESYQPQPDPLQQQLAQLEVAIKQAELQKVQAEVRQLLANAQLSAAKAGTEQVKQGNLQSDTDLKNLDFVEQESGVKQERAKELHGEQARAQAQLKLLDHSFKREEQRRDLLKEYLLSKRK